MPRPDLLLIGPLPPWDIEALEADYVLHRYWEAADKQALLARLAPVIEAIATRGDLGVTADIIKSLPKLKVISCYGVGIDGIDRAAARVHGVKVTNTPDVLTEDVADAALGLLIATARQIPQTDKFVRDGKWTQGVMPLSTRFWGKRLGIAGMGRIGTAIARRAEAFKMEISYFARSKKEALPYRYVASLTELASQVDFLLAILPGDASTAKLINAGVFKALGPQGIFVNIARGSVVDEAALLDALENKRIKAAGLDVFLNEPNIDPRFLTLENAVLQSHTGSGTVETRQAMGKLMRDNLAAYFAGKPLLTEVG